MTQKISPLGIAFLDGIRESAGAAIAVGVVLVIAGGLAIGSPIVAGLSVSLFVGVMLLIGGIGQLVLAYKAGSFGKGQLSTIIGMVTVMVGLLMIIRPGAILTIFMTAFFLLTGIIESFWAFQIKPDKGWGWTLFSGIVSVLLGCMIWGQYPFSGAWVLGAFVGIRLLFSGLTLIMLGSAARGAVKEVKSTS
jgi:uncharacterized membrane protein HdeD (DUF308 family)